MTEYGGFGHVGNGRCAFGQALSEYEPRFSQSYPIDGATGISVFDFTILFSLYCFSSRVQWANGTGFLVEISEDGGGSYAPGYENGAFVAPYNGANSRVDAQQGDAQEFVMYLHKTSPWLDDKEIRVRVTAADEYDEESTKEVPVEW